MSAAMTYLAFWEKMQCLDHNKALVLVSFIVTFFMRFDVL